MKWLLSLLCAVTISSAVALDIPDRPEALQPAGYFTWDIPTNRADGSVLGVEEIDGYELYIQGTAAGSEVLTVWVDDPAATSYEQNLSPGEYEIAMRTKDTDGTYSVPSQVVTFTISGKAGPNPVDVLRAAIKYVLPIIEGE